MEQLASIQPVFLACVLVWQLFLLLSAAWVDVASRLIPNSLCLGLGITGALGRLLIGPPQMAESIAAAGIVFIILLPLHSRQLLGGGDVKLLAAITIGLPPAGVLQLFSITALAGGILALLHLAMRRLPRPKLAHARSSVFRRIYTAERWRILRRAPLPYGVAIACGGIWAMLTNTGV
jgi:prepilin peptidase CpaA